MTPALKIDYIGAEELAELLPPRDAVSAVREALIGGLDVAADPPRSVLALPGGQGATPVHAVRVRVRRRREGHLLRTG